MPLACSSTYVLILCDLQVPCFLRRLGALGLFCAKKRPLEAVYCNRRTASGNSSLNIQKSFLPSSSEMTSTLTEFPHAFKPAGQEFRTRLILLSMQVLTSAVISVPLFSVTNLLNSSIMISPFIFKDTIIMKKINQNEKDHVVFTFLRKRTALKQRHR